MLREISFAHAMQLKLFDPKKFVAIVFDHLLYRLPSQAPSKGNAHCDISPLKRMAR
jgi:hypothetical protein